MKGLQFLGKHYKLLILNDGPLAQLGERRVRNAEAVGSNPMRSTTYRPQLTDSQGLTKSECSCVPHAVPQFAPAAS